MGKSKISGGGSGLYIKNSKEEFYNAFDKDILTGFFVQKVPRGSLAQYNEYLSSMRISGISDVCMISEDTGVCFLSGANDTSTSSQQMYGAIVSFDSAGNIITVGTPKLLGTEYNTYIENRVNLASLYLGNNLVLVAYEATSNHTRMLKTIKIAGNTFTVVDTKYDASNKCRHFHFLIPMHDFIVELYYGESIYIHYSILRVNSTGTITIVKDHIQLPTYFSFGSYNADAEVYVVDSSTIILNVCGATVSAFVLKVDTSGNVTQSTEYNFGNADGYTSIEHVVNNRYAIAYASRLNRRAYIFLVDLVGTTLTRISTALQIFSTDYNGYDIDLKKLSNGKYLLLNKSMNIALGSINASTGAFTVEDLGENMVLGAFGRTGRMVLVNESPIVWVSSHENYVLGISIANTLDAVKKADTGIYGVTKSKVPKSGEPGKVLVLDNTKNYTNMYSIADDLLEQIKNDTIQEVQEVTNGNV